MVGEAVGSVEAVWRYPVKSMQGETVERCSVLEGGVVGDRAFALFDEETGKLASAKSPRMWPNLLDFSAAFVESPVAGQPLPAVRITTPSGRIVETDDPAVADVLAEETGRRVRLVTSNPEGALLEQYLPPVEGADPSGADLYRDVLNDVFGTGSLYDAAPLHLVATATLDRLGELSTESRFDVRRFRPNLVVRTEGPSRFVEHEWEKQTLLVGSAQIRVTFATLRCVMTTRPQGDLPQDLEVLRTATRHNRRQVLSLGRYPCVGVYGLVTRPGPVGVGDAVRLSDESGAAAVRSANPPSP